MAREPQCRLARARIAHEFGACPARRGLGELGGRDERPAAFQRQRELLRELVTNLGRQHERADRAAARLDVDVAPVVQRGVRVPAITEPTAQPDVERPWTTVGPGDLHGCPARAQLGERIVVVAGRGRRGVLA
jgi:hypothetical protein